MNPENKSENPANETPPRAPWPAGEKFSRESVRTSIEEATGAGLSVDDPTPDTLIAAAEAAGMQPADLRMWIHDGPGRKDWTAAALTRWASRYGFPQQQTRAPLPARRPDPSIHVHIDMAMIPPRHRPRVYTRLAALMNDLAKAATESEAEQ